MPKLRKNSSPQSEEATDWLLLAEPKPNENLHCEDSECAEEFSDENRGILDSLS